MRALKGPKKPIFKFFEIFLLSELVCTYDKLNIYAKKCRVTSTLSDQTGGVFDHDHYLLAL